METQSSPISAMSEPRRDILKSLENVDLKGVKNARSDGYSWYTPGDTLVQKRSKMDERRIQLMESLHGEDLAPEVAKGRVSEWIALQRERDSLLRQLIDQENEEAKVAFVQDLKRMLRDAPHFLASSSDQHMYCSLMDFRSQLGEYCVSHNITSPLPSAAKGDRVVATGNATGHTGPDSMAASSSYALPESLSLVPPPPPLPSPSHGSVRVNSIQQQDCIDGESTTTTTGVANRGNQVIKQVSFLEEIVHHKERRTLKRTGVPRTPGGTPIRPRGQSHNLTSCSTHGDIIQQALLRKFRSVRIHSTPKKRPERKLTVTGSGSIECSNAWSEYGSEHGCHFASDPDLTRSDSSFWDTGGSHVNLARSAAEFDDPSSPGFVSGRSSTAMSPAQMQFATSI